MRQRLPDIRLQTLLQTSVSRHSSRHRSLDSPPDICLQTLLQTSVSRLSSRHLSPDTPPNIRLQTLLQTSVSRHSSKHPSPDSPRTSDNVLFTIRRQRRHVTKITTAGW